MLTVISTVKLAVISMTGRIIRKQYLYKDYCTEGNSKHPIPSQLTLNDPAPCTMFSTGFVSPNAFCIGLQYLLVWRCLASCAPLYIRSQNPYNTSIHGNTI